MKFVLDGEYTTLNEYSNANRIHYHAGASIKKAETARAAIELKEQWDGMPVGKAVFKFSWHRKNRRTDPDNIIFAKKFLLDALQEVGIIDNDGWKQIAGFEDVWEVDSENPRVEIEIIEVGT